MFCDEERKIRVGDEEWSYRIFYSEDGTEDTVRLFDADGAYVTEFFSAEDMRNYLSGEGLESRLRALQDVRRFRKEERDLLRKYSESGETLIDSETKQEMRATLIKRFKMLMGDLSGVEMGKILGLSPGTVYNYATGGRYLSGYALRRISERCGVGIEWLLGKDK